MDAEGDDNGEEEEFNDVSNKRDAKASASESLSDKSGAHIDEVGVFDNDNK